jgi:hypothetical protein
MLGKVRLDKPLKLLTSPAATYPRSDIWLKEKWRNKIGTISFLRVLLLFLLNLVVVFVDLFVDLLPTFCWCFSDCCLLLTIRKCKKTKNKFKALCIWSKQKRILLYHKLAIQLDFTWTINFEQTSSKIFFFLSKIDTLKLRFNSFFSLKNCFVYISFIIHSVYFLWDRFSMSPKSGHIV